MDKMVMTRAPGAGEARVHLGLPGTAECEVVSALRAVAPALQGAGTAVVVAGEPGAADRPAASDLARLRLQYDGLVLHAPQAAAFGPRALRARLEAAGWTGPLKVVAVVSDASRWLSARYARRAVALSVALPVRAAVRAGLLAGHAAPERLLRPFITGACALTVLPLVANEDARPVSVRVLEALGVGDALMPPPMPAEKLPDPRHVEAGRRLACWGMRVAAPAQRAAGAAALQDAARRWNWCDSGWAEPFWGIDARLARDIAWARAGAQERLAKAVWGAPWCAVHAPPDAPQRANAWQPYDDDGWGEAAMRAVIHEVAARVDLPLARFRRPRRTA